MKKAMTHDETQMLKARVEDLEKKEYGRKVGSIKIPAVVWQDDVTLIPNDKEEERNMIEEFIFHDICYSYL